MSAALSSAAFGAVALTGVIAARFRAKHADAKSSTPAAFHRVPLSELPPLQNDLLLRAAKGALVERAPVWVMRQAGRYLPEYRDLRIARNFFHVCRTPELVARVTLQPLERFPELDAAIIFSDILVVPQAMGMECIMTPGRGPVFPQRLESPADLARLTLRPDVESSLGYVMDGINLTRQRLQGKVPLIGFCGGPWTLMAYMVEGGGSRTHEHCKTWLYKHRAASHTLLAAITDILIEFLVAQVHAGAQMLQVFESTAGELTPALFAEFSLPYLRRIAAAVKERLSVPMVVFARGAGYALEQLCASEYDVLGVDWATDPAFARRVVGSRKTLQGNLDPIALFADPEEIERRTQAMVEGFANGGQRLICNLGHGMLPTHDPERLRVFLRATHRATAAAAAGTSGAAAGAGSAAPSDK